jgi:hypothetical protein
MAANSGGRVTFVPNSEVRILCSDGKISQEIYEVESERSDRNGHVALLEKRTRKPSKVQHRRILPVGVEGCAAVIESAGKYRAICPQCTYVEMVEPSNSHLDCSFHGKSELYWIGVKPMSDVVTKSDKVDSAEKVESTEKNVPKLEKAAKVVKQTIVVDLNDIASKPNCELWTRSDVKFDHERVSVKAHTLLFVGDNPRKFCFNTYDGTLGKRCEPLPIANFMSDTPVTNGKKDRPWYQVADIAKARAKLLKDGYEQHK